MDAGAIDNLKTSFVKATTSSPSKASQKTAPSPSSTVFEADSVNISDVSQKAEATSKSDGNTDLQRRLSVTVNNQVVMKVIDSKTKDVVKQIPPEELIRLKEAIREATDKSSVTDEIV